MLHISIDARNHKILLLSARKVCHHEEKISLNQRVAAIPLSLSNRSRMPNVVSIKIWTRTLGRTIVPLG